MLIDNLNKVKCDGDLILYIRERLLDPDFKNRLEFETRDKKKSDWNPYAHRAMLRLEEFGIKDYLITAYIDGDGVHEWVIQRLADTIRAEISISPN